jgi:hypothetical protein
MTPEQKAIELLEKLIPHVYNEYDGSDGGKVYNAKRHTIQCALITVNEIIKSRPSLPILGDGYILKDIELSTKYWKEVKQELEKL